MILWKRNTFFLSLFSIFIRFRSFVGNSQSSAIHLTIQENNDYYLTRCESSALGYSVAFVGGETILFNRTSIKAIWFEQGISKK